MAEEEKEAPQPSSPRVRRLCIAGAAGLAAALVGTVTWLAVREPATSTELVLFGNVDVREVDVAFNEGDRIVTMQVEEGDPVEAGQLLAEIDSSRLEHLVLEAEARVAAQRAVVARFEHGSRPEEIQRARAEVEAAQAELADAAVTHERFEKLGRGDAASQQRVDDARAAHLLAQARLKVAEENLRLAIEGPRAEDTEAARSELRAAENALELARHRLADTRLYAPADGTVLTRILEPGAVVLPNSPVYTLALADVVWVRAYLSEPDLGRVFPGMKAEITSDSFPDRTHEGWVGFISPTAEFTPKPVETPDLRTSLVYRTRIYVRNPDHTLRQGMPVTVRLSLAQPPPSAADAPRDAPEPKTSGPAGGVEGSDAASVPQPPRERPTP
jgi:HlyD family secretion protein